MTVPRDPEADVCLTALGSAPAAHRASRPGEPGARVRAAAQHALAVARLRRRPFPDVARHVLETVRARATRERADGRRRPLLETGADGGAARVRLVAPREPARVRPARGLLPLRLGRQP